MKLVIVESPAKAKTINKYLGTGYKVIASFGHVRDLPSKNGSVLPDNNFEMKYEAISRSQKYIKTICDEAKNADTIYLATDPDREGEAISWHVVELLKSKKILKHNPTIKRIAFNEITKKAVLNAIENPRDLDVNLIDAQQARRALDYLVGFTLSPVLWKKLPGCRSAGRVQSVALRLVSDREAEIENFVSQEYWNILLTLAKSNDQEFIAKLVEFNGEKLEKFSIPNSSHATSIEEILKKESGYQVNSVQHKEQRRNPAAPFTTSSMQQEAARKLYFSAKKTMQVAQKLYEGVEVNGETVGLITYMRTDGVYIAGDAINQIRELIGGEYGDKYLPKSPRMYKSKAKNAQEAHEAIRPTNIALKPAMLKGILDSDLYKLYELIWKRTMSCQMESALFNQVVVDIVTNSQQHKARAVGSTLVFDGFYKIYKEGVDEASDDDDDKLLPVLKEAESLALKDVNPTEHHTEPPPRYSEASLVKKLEEYGIGRPSTYATIMSVIQERNYVRLEKKRFIPESRGRIVTSFLVQYFSKYVEYDFTAKLEDQLDDIAVGKAKLLKVLEEFWAGFTENVEAVSHNTIGEVIDSLNTLLETHLFPKNVSKTCPSCSVGELKLKLGKFGGFLSCSNYPDCSYTQPIGEDGEEYIKKAGMPASETDKVLGQNENAEDVWVKKGPYGWYVQLGEPKGKVKPKRMSIPPSIVPEEITLEQALRLLSLPKLVGKDPESGEEIMANIGKYGPYLKQGKLSASLPKGDDLFSISLERAVEVIHEAQELKKKKAAEKKKK